MRKIIYDSLAKNFFTTFILLLLISFILHGCNCKDKKGRCRDSLVFQSVHLTGFSNLEIDTILFRSYNQGSNFSSLVDSFYEYTNFSSTGIIVSIGLSKSFDINLDWKITFSSLGGDYTLTDFKIQQRTCATCFLAHYFENYLDGYKVNGVYIKSKYETIAIDK